MDKLILYGLVYFFYNKNKQLEELSIDSVMEQSKLSNELMNKQNRLESMFKSNNKFDTGGDIIGVGSTVLM